MVKDHSDSDTLVETNPQLLEQNFQRFKDTNEMKRVTRIGLYYFLTCLYFLNWAFWMNEWRKCFI